MRIWILSALGVGVVVAIILIATAPDKPVPPRRPDVTEGEVQIYVRFIGLRDRILQRTSDTAAAGGPRPAKGEIRDKLARESMKLGRPLHEMDKLVRRVEYVVDGVRWEENPSLSKQAVQDQIDVLESKKPMNPAERALLQDEIAGLKLRLDGPKLRDAERTLIKKHWQTLNRLAPRRFGQ